MLAALPGHSPVSDLHQGREQACGADGCAGKVHDTGPTQEQVHQKHGKHTLDPGVMVCFMFFSSLHTGSRLAVFWSDLSQRCCRGMHIVCSEMWCLLVVNASPTQVTESVGAGEFPVH